MFLQIEGKIWGLPSSSDSFFSKYLDVFDSVKILGGEVRKYLDNSRLVEITNEKISVEILPRNTFLKEFKNDKIVKKALFEHIKSAEAILIKPLSRRGMMAIKIAEQLKKPYMIEMTGDIHNALKQNSSFLRKAYAPLLYRNIKKTIKKAPFGLYVSKDYLQSKYPIAGRMCGCSDVILDKADDEVLKKRLDKIEKMEKNKIIKLALIGFYQGKGKGVDTAIRALSRLPENFELSVLGNGTKESREKWYKYAHKMGVDENRLHFPEPLSSSKEVLKWLDDYDFFVFPTRSEGLSRCIAEAMSRGCPSFATKICSMPELLQERCLFKLGDDKKLAELLLKYVDNKELMKEDAIINFNHAKDYDFDLLKERRDNFLTEFKDYCLK